MLKKSVQNIDQSFSIGIILVCFLVFSSLRLYAQGDTLGTGEEGYTEVEKYDDPDKISFFHRTPADSFYVQQRNVPDSIVTAMQKDEDFWYANAVIEKEKPQPEKKAGRYIPLGQRTWFQTFLWLLIIGGFAAAVLWYLSSSNVGLFRRKNRIETAGEEQEITEDIFAINYQREIERAAAQRDYRLAVRLMFLRLLKNMADRNIIRYKQDKTNIDYLLQLYSTTYYNDFFRITRNYEYSWYGKFEVSEDAYKIIRTDFDHLERKLG